MPATVTITPSNTVMDNMQVLITPQGGVEADAGGIEGGVEIDIKTKTVRKTYAQYGDTTIDKTNAGKSVMVTLRFKETTKARLYALLYGSTRRTTGGEAVGVGCGYAGTENASDKAFKIRLHPILRGDSVLDWDVNVWKATPPEDFKVAYETDKYTMYEAACEVIPDFTKTGKEFLDFGLNAAV